MLTSESMIDHVTCGKCNGSGFQKTSSLIIRDIKTKEFTVFHGLTITDVEEWLLDESLYSAEEDEVRLECSKCNGKGEVLSFDRLFADGNNSFKDGKTDSRFEESESSNTLSLNPFQKAQPRAEIHITSTESSYDYWKLREFETKKKSFDKKCQTDNTVKHYRKRNFLRYAKGHGINLNDDQITQYLRNSLSPKKWFLDRGILAK